MSYLASRFPKSLMDPLIAAKDCYANVTCTFMLSILTCKELDWSSAVWDSDPQVKSSANYFAGLVREVFEYPMSGKHFSAAA